jgi:hypothetical protein
MKKTSRTMPGGFRADRYRVAFSKRATSWCETGMGLSEFSCWARAETFTAMLFSNSPRAGDPPRKKARGGAPVGAPSQESSFCRITS